MRQYVARRLALFVPTLVGASLLVFVLMRLVPGDIAEILVYQTGSESSVIQTKQIQQIRAELGLDRPVAIQYLAWMGGALRGDFGQSYTQRRPVWDILAERVPRSLELAVLTLAIAVVWAIPLGVISAVRQNSWLDYAARVLSLSGLSLPLFVTGVLILYGLVRLFRWIPPLEFVAFTENPVVNRHALKNALLPVVTFIGWWGGRLLGGVVIMEMIFVVPGMGTALLQAVSQRGYPTGQAMIFVVALVFLTVNLVVDLLYAWIDPRIRY